EFRTLLPRLFEAIGDGSAADDVEAATLEVEVAVARDVQAVLELLGTLAESDEPYALEARWEGAPVTSPLRAIAIARDDASATYVEAALLRDDAVRAAFEALVAADGPGLIAHRAKELMHGLDLDVRSLLHDTAVMAYLLDPGSGKFLLEDLALRFLALE